jgi:hypothetical protein
MKTNQQTATQRHNARQDKIWQACQKAKAQQRDTAPLPKQIAIGKTDGEFVDENGFYVGDTTKREIVRRYNNAERLAEVLKDALSYIETVTWNADDISQKETAAIREALAQWEGGKPSQDNE